MKLSKRVRRGFTDDGYESLAARNKKFNGKAHTKASFYYEETGANEWSIYFVLKTNFKRSV
jgi:hypothetical protein